MDSMGSESPLLEPFLKQMSDCEVIQGVLEGPVSGLPVEILSQIFGETILAPSPSPSSSEICTTLPTSRLPEIRQIGDGIGSKILCKVSKHWRAVAVVTPLLWSSFSFTLFSGNYTIEQLEWYLTQSRECPLTVEIKTQRPIAGGPTGEHEIALLAKHSERLYRIALHPFATGFAIPSIRGFRGRLSRLEILEICNGWERLADTFEIAPRLKRVAFSGSVRALDVILPRDQILSLRLWNVVAGTATAYSNITHLDCNRFDPWGSFHLPHVRSWKVDTVDSFYRAAYNAKMPSLETLHISQESAGTLDFMPFVTNIEQQSKCALKTLILENCFLQPPEMLQFLGRVPTLRVLIMRGGNPMTVTDKLLNALAVRPDQQSYLPHLTALHIHGAYLFHDHALYEVLRTRASSGIVTALEIVDIAIPHRAVAPADVRALQALGVFQLSLRCHDGERNMTRMI
ncbi:hypothetical protein FB451DRAFT_441738 [Mycena latifolia]|nr:hypothetical protein FB451DRAFT_441738 [Mycena latifolia]